ncbi:hypothetical protein R3P38DRAFT_3449829 [Favolaschia claudopus]|uniref:Uncharacterized protein n=1 Tax=Favolaschia claudopus TaxID=2862362 RepID=A0AAV9ZMN7_9AGAR
MDSSDDLKYSAVAHGDTILIEESALGPDNQPIKIEWKQQFGERRADYIETGFKVVERAKGEVEPANPADHSIQTEGRIFIQASMLEDFKKKTLADRIKFVIVVNGEFMYGQKDQTGVGRFIVFHDKKNDTFQHRFIQGVAMKYAEKARDVAEQLGFSSPRNMMNELRGILGDRLHTFQ